MIDPFDPSALSPSEVEPPPTLRTGATRADVAAYARGLARMSANPADPCARAAYLDLVAPGETPARAAEMATMSGCALTARAVLRRFIAHPLLAAPYRTGQAMADLVRIASEADALRSALWPMAGDVVIVGGGADGGGTEHTWIALEDSWGIDGGQRDGAGFQRIARKGHTIAGGRDGGRMIRYVLDVDAILRALGR